MRITIRSISTSLALLADCEDADVIFMPLDPEANDTYALNPDEVHLSWTLGHVIVHTTASAEEAAFIAAELARGVPFHGRSRSETTSEKRSLASRSRPKKRSLSCRLKVRGPT